MTSPRNQIIKFIERGIISEDKISDALRATQVFPDSKSWRTFIDNLLLWLGGLALAFAVMFFVAYNWNAIGRFAKFGMVEGIIVLAIVAYCRLGENTTASKVSLLVATISLGVLLALYGQTYQTGADPWQLFFSWAVLLLPWALIGRFPAIWVVWVILINLAIILYHQTFSNLFWILLGSPGMLLMVFCFNTLVLAAWEFLAKRWQWLSESWAIRILAAGSIVPITMLALNAIFGNRTVSAVYGLLWTLWLPLMLFVYRKLRPDLFMLASSCLSVIIVSVSFIGKHVLNDGSSASFLFLALVVICMGTGAAFWLKNVHQECQS
ncbi:MAG: DUF2157 domain-containing protein [Candidatus Riflebacteria bacterium]|nr:DUF2157 domain-containing protein [Candidatus Riflebacteria bacterium]